MTTYIILFIVLLCSFLSILANDNTKNILFNIFIIVVFVFYLVLTKEDYEEFKTTNSETYLKIDKSSIFEDPKYIFISTINGETYETTDRAIYVNFINKQKSPKVKDTLLKENKIAMLYEDEEGTTLVSLNNSDSKTNSKENNKNILERTFTDQQSQS